jgi:hypothetical protein
VVEVTMESKKSPGVSRKLMGLKFMQRAQAKIDLSQMKEEQQKAQQEVRVERITAAVYDSCLSVHHSRSQ